MRTCPISLTTTQVPGSLCCPPVTHTISFSLGLLMNSKLTSVVNSSSSLFLPPVLSSLSSQSPPASPFLTLSSDLPPPLLPVSPSHPETLSLSQSRPETFSLSERKPWSQRVWPEGGRHVLTHLVEGFIIQEGLQAFPVNTHTQFLQGI